MGDAFPDFDKMTLEEQMAWLESLAKRQGVKDEELTTKADLDIPIPEDAQVDEPGYVPFEGSASARRLKEAQEAAAQGEPVVEPDLEFEPEPEPEFVPEAEAEPEPEIEPLFEPESELEPEPRYEPEPEPELELDFLAEEEPVEVSLWDMAEPIEDTELFAEAADAADPMLWLDSLSAQPEGELDDLFADSDAFALEGGEQPIELESPEPSAVADEELAIVQPAGAGDDDPLGGMDPMVWLESLAKRQGANPDELVTSANLEVAEVDDRTVIDEPGYVPFEGSASARRLKESQEAEAAFDASLLEAEAGIDQEPAEQEPATFAPEAAPVEDSMLWLESLAKRQGANPDELLTQADLDIPELPADTLIDEPGYVEYSPFSILPDQEIEIPEPEQAAAGSEDAALSWLEDLVAEPGEDLSQILAFGEDMFEPVDEEAIESEAPPASAAIPVRDDPLAGMTDEEVAYAQAHGQLTGEQELAWLKRQAAKLAEVRESQEAEIEFQEEEEGEAVPAELPPWLLEMRDEVEPIDLEAIEAPAEEAALPEESVDFSEWLEETPVPEELDLDLPIFDAAVLAQEDVDSLWGETPESEIELEDIGLPDDSELAKFLAEGIVPEGADPLAEALDAEFDRKLIGDETEPEWYTDAVAKAAADASAVPETEIEPAIEEQPAEGLAEAAPVDMPDWLREEGEEVISAGDVDMPGWLMEVGEPEAAAEPEEPAWLSEPEPAYMEPAAEEDLPSWLRDLDKAPDEAVFAEEFAQLAEAELPEPEPPVAIPTPPAPIRAAPPEPEIRRPPAVQPEVRGELMQKITQRLQQDPNDHASRLAFARALRDSRQTVPSLDQYETLIDTSQLLQDVSNDLASMTEAHSSMPRVRRLLGDAYMRRGLLQEALSAYRSALEQL